MSTGPTYGELLDETARHLARAAGWMFEPFVSEASALGALSAYESFNGSLRRHLALILGSHVTAAVGAGAQTELVAAAGDLLRVLRPCQPRRLESKEAAEATGHPAARAWDAATGSLRLAHDVLASHLGPDRQYLTPDAHLVDQVDQQRGALSLIGSLALTSAMAARPLGLRLAEFAPSATTRGGAERALADHERIPGAASILAEMTNGGDGSGKLTALGPAVRRLSVIRAGDPLEQAISRVDWLAQRAHDDARSSTPVGSTTMQAFAVLGVSVHQHCAVMLSAAAAQAGRILPGHERSGLLASLTAQAEHARRNADAWRHAYQAWEGLATPAPGSRLVLQQVTEVRRNLASVTRTDGRWKDPAVLVADAHTARRLLGAVESLKLRMDQISGSHEAIVKSEQTRGQWYMPRRDAPAQFNPIQLVGAHRYAPSTAGRIHSVTRAYQGFLST